MPLNTSQARDFFLKADSNHDGVLDKAEFIGAYGMHMSAEAIALFSRVATTGDGPSDKPGVLQAFHGGVLHLGGREAREVEGRG